MSNAIEQLKVIEAKNSFVQTCRTTSELVELGTSSQQLTLFIKQM